MTTQYHLVNGRIRGSNDWMPFLKQLHVSSGVWSLYFMNGLASGAPTVFVPQIRKNWNTTTIDDDLASWLYSASNFAALPWLLMLPVLTHITGRKIPYLACCVALTAVYSLLYFSSTPYHILIAEAIQGFSNAMAATVIFHVIPEYCNHKYRSIYLNIQCTSFYWGMWVANAIGTFFDWKYIAVLGLMCTIYSFTLSFYPESPRWLASKGRFAECQTAFRWLRGSGTEAEQELRDLIKAQTSYQEDKAQTSYREDTACTKFREMLMCRQFYLPLFLVILIGALYNFSGKFVCSIYAIEIFKKISKNEAAAYTGMLTLDGVTVIGMYIGSFLSKIFKLRTLYFSLSLLSIGVIFSFSLYLYLANIGVICENNIIALAFLVLYSLAISSGPIVLSLNFYSAIVSIRYQAISYAIGSFIFLVSCTMMLKFMPVIFNGLGLHGSFLFYGIGCSIVMALLYIYLPETSNKTLEEIQECFKEKEDVSEIEVLTKPVNSELKA